MKKEVHVCDVCLAERKDANHWFAASIWKGTISFTQWVGRLPEYDTCKAFEGDKVKHICGQVCAHKLLDQFLSGELK